MTKQIKQFQRLPAIIKSFEEIPDKLKGETSMLNTIDLQLQ